jgi:hypothetical protein
MTYFKTAYFKTTGWPCQMWGKMYCVWYIHIISDPNTHVIDIKFAIWVRQLWLGRISMPDCFCLIHSATGGSEGETWKWGWLFGVRILKGLFKGHYPINVAMYMLLDISIEYYKIYRMSLAEQLTIRQLTSISKRIIFHSQTLTTAYLSQSKMDKTWWKNYTIWLLGSKHG